MKTSRIVCAVIFTILFIVGIMALVFVLTPSLENYRTSVKQEIDKNSYETRKLVEDTCRSMISSYKSDLLTYETYINSEDKEEQSWAKQAKIRANKTATSYNEYVLKNSFVWSDNIPDDINSSLSVIE